MYDKIVIGMDQSYQNTGISIAADGILKSVTSIDLSKLKTNTDKRETIKGHAVKACRLCLNRSDNVIVLIERIRLYSRGIISTAYIQSMGALNAAIVDSCASCGVSVFSIDTRAWKSAVLGTNGKQDNEFGVPAEKWPCVDWVISQGFENSILVPVTGRKVKGTFMRDGLKYMYNNDAADSAGIAVAGFLAGDAKFKLEI